MSSGVGRDDVDGFAGVNSKRLFTGSCFGIGASAMTFVAISAVMGPLKEHFVLSNEQVGWIGGAAMWGFTVTILTFGSLCDVVGMRLVLRLAVVGHVVGAVLMIFASGFAMLFAGALTLSMADGLVQAACNPLIATLYADRKTEMFNKLHRWFPGGIVVGGLIAFGLDRLPIESWQLKLALILAPAMTYGTLFLGQKFPATERVQSGVSFGAMFKETFFRPLFLVLLVSMMMTASIELGPNRWVPAVLESAGIPGILVLVWISLVMTVLRSFAGSIGRRLSPTGILLSSAILSGLGLLWLSYAVTSTVAFVAATVFAVGIAYFWPTMIGVTSERVPKGGALALAMMGAAGTVSVGLVTAPMMGRVADSHLNEKLPVDQTISCLERAVEDYSGGRARAEGRSSEDIGRAVENARNVLDVAGRTNALPEIDTANALRSVITAAPESTVANAANELLGPADNYGGRISFRWVALLSILLTVVFGVLYLRDRARGGYRVEKLSSKEAI
ncbi:MAG: MFS transporter [Planctomycetota bacterium]